MILKSLGRQTELIFADFSSEVLDKDVYVAIKTPSNPGYHWGNYLIFRAAPKRGDLVRWKQIFDAEFDYYQTPHHYVFTWDTETAADMDYQEFLDAGFHFDTAAVLTAQRVVPPKYPNSKFSVRKLSTDQDWQDVINNQITCADPKYLGDGYRDFKNAQFREYRSMSEAGMGHWYGGYIENKLVGDLGIFYKSDIGRFQSIGTHPDFRRQGICGTLVYETAKIAFAEYGVKTLVMEADVDYHAARIYESVGFKNTEINHSLSWWRGC